MSNTSHDTIVAIATAPGRGGVGVVRLSGPDALPIAKTICGGRELTPRMAHFARFRDATGEVIDEGLVIYFPAPNSFTGEEVVELQGHGGPVILDLLVKACIDAGGRQALAGEFSQRAFLNGRIDLAQAEAVADMVAAPTDLSLKAAREQLGGRLSREVTAVRDRCLDLLAQFEAENDFTADDVPAVDRRVRIPMAPGVDSVNVATAAAIALSARYGWG